MARLDNNRVEALSDALSCTCAMLSNEHDHPQVKLMMRFFLTKNNGPQRLSTKRLYYIAYNYGYSARVIVVKNKK